MQNILPKLHKTFHNNIELGENILTHIEKNPKSRVKIITLTREPVERAISDLFENWEHIYDDIEKVPLDELKEHIESLQHNYTLKWFDTEFREYLNFDIYKYPFPKDKGYEIYSFENYDILCIKLEKLNSVAEISFSDFLDEKLHLSRSNSSQDKNGKEAYNFLKQNVKIDKKLLMDIYDSKYVSHFYSRKEINDFISRWS